MLFDYTRSIRKLASTFSVVRISYLKHRMAACFSSSGEIAVPPTYVLSHIPKIAESLKNFKLPGIQIKSIDVSDISKENPIFSEEKIKTFKDAEVLICDANLLVKVYKSLPNLNWAHSTWAGVDSLLKEMDEEPTFTLTRHGGYAFCRMMAEYVLCHMLNCERQTKLCLTNQNSKVWSQDGKISNYRSLQELTVTILGVGNMASQIAQLLKLQQVTVYGFAKNSRTFNCFGDFEKISTNLEDLLGDADYIINTLPSTPLTHKILSPSVIVKCKKRPCFINVGRGDVIDETVLVQALRNGYFSGAVLDVFQTEPLPVSSQLWDMPQVIITPHVAAVSKPDDIAEEFISVYWSYIKGHKLRNVVNWSERY